MAFNLNTESNAVLATDLTGDFGKIWYSAGDLDNEDRKDLSASFLFQPSSTNFRLAILESLRQVAADRRTVRTVNNRRDVNIFAVVPSYFIDLSPVSRIRVAYSYSRIDEEFDASSRDVKSVTAGYQYRVSNMSSWSLNASQSNIEFIDTGQEFDQESAYFRWSYEGLLTNWNLDLGRQQIVDGENTDETLLTFSIDRDVNNFATVGLFYYQGYNDVINTSVSNRLTQLVANEDAVFAEEIAKEQSSSVFYDYTRDRLGARVSLETRELKSEEALSIGREVDEERHGIRFSSNYRFRDDGYNLSRFGVAVNYRYSREVFNLEDEEIRVNEGGIRLDYYANRSVRMFFGLSSRNAAGTGFRAETDERSVIVGIRFAPRGGI
ncbi:MAG: hypothetical protein WDZ30_11570 [Cellvibrionaceae bacterium]